MTEETRKMRATFRADAEAMNKLRGVLAKAAGGAVPADPVAAVEQLVGQLAKQQRQLAAVVLATESIAALIRG